MDSSSRRKCDVFLSYKREDADFVRPIAEALLSGEINVWFNEYQILIQGRENFLRLIDEGLAASQTVIVFSSRRYAASSVCMREFTHFLETGKRMLEIQLEPNGIWAGNNPPVCTVQVGAPATLESAWHSICSFLGLEAKNFRDFSATPAVCARERTTFQYHDVRFDSGGWRLVSGAARHGDTRMVVGRYERNAQDWRCRMRFEIEETISFGRLPFLSSDEDDLEGFEQTLTFAGELRRVEGVPVTCVGTHVIMHSGYRHVGVTFQRTGDARLIIRKYSILLPSLYSRYVDFHVTIVFYGDWREFLRVAHTFDSFVRSIQWEASAAGKIEFSPEFKRDSARRQKKVQALLAGLLKPGVGRAVASRVSFMIGRVLNGMGCAEAAIHKYRRSWRLNRANDSAVSCLVRALMNRGRFAEAVECAVDRYGFMRSRENLNRVLDLLMEYLKSGGDAAARAKMANDCLEWIYSLMLISPYSELPYLAMAQIKAIKGDPQAEWMSDLDKARGMLRLRKFAREDVPLTEAHIETYINPTIQACQRYAKSA
jgi:hypothetical protein